jgi:hypothetical protein
VVAFLGCLALFANTFTYERRVPLSLAMSVSSKPSFIKASSYVTRDQLQTLHPGSELIIEIDRERSHRPTFVRASVTDVTSVSAQGAGFVVQMELSVNAMPADLTIHNQLNADAMLVTGRSKLFKGALGVLDVLDKRQ